MRIPLVDCFAGLYLKEHAANSWYDKPPGRTLCEQALG